MLESYLKLYKKKEEGYMLININKIKDLKKMITCHTKVC